MRLRQGALIDNLRDFCDQVSLNQHIFAIGILQAGAYVSGVFFDRCLLLNGNVPSPSPRARFAVNVHREQDGEASTKPQRRYAGGIVAVARFWGGQFLVAT